MKSKLVFCLLSAYVLLTLAAAAGGEDYFIYVGSYTDAPSHSKGIYAWRFEPSSGSVTPLGLVAETVNPFVEIPRNDHRPPAMVYRV